MNITLAGLLLGGGVTVGTWLASKIHIAFAVVLCIFFLMPLAGYIFLANMVSETVIDIATHNDWRVDPKWIVDRKWRPIGEKPQSRIVLGS